MKSTLSVGTTLRTSMRLGVQQLTGLKLLAKSLPDMRAEVLNEIATNPALEDVDNPLERTMSDVEKEHLEDPDDRRDSPSETEDFEPLERRYDEEAIERRQAFFDNQTGSETLQQHLTAQLPLSDVAEEDRPLAETLIGDIDANGYYRGSVPDVCMAYGCDEKKIVSVLEEISLMDPPGCGARNARECLRAQLDSVADEAVREDVAYLIDHLVDLAAGRINAAEYATAIKALKTLDPHPGRGFLSEKDRVEYINPEVHSFKDDDGHWCAITDKRSLPEIRISKKFERILADPNASAETKAYVKERIDRARTFQEAVRNRQETVENIAQAIFDRQQDFFEHGMKALKPLTELEIAAALGIAGPTVSRTVCDKYAQTPQGTIELRRFFTSGIKNAAGEEIAQSAALDCLKKLVNAEDKSNPLSDEKLSAALKAAGYPIARRTVAKYRDKLSIPGVAGRRR